MRKLLQAGDPEAAVARATRGVAELFRALLKHTEAVPRHTKWRLSIEESLTTSMIYSSQEIRFGGDALLRNVSDPAKPGPLSVLRTSLEDSQQQ